MPERIGDPTFQEYHLVNNNGYGGQSYNISADAEQSLGPVVVTQQMRENTADNVAAGLMEPHGQMLRQLKNEPQSTAQTRTPETGEVRGAVADLNTPEGRAQNEKNQNLAEAKERHDVLAFKRQQELAKQQKPFVADKGDHFEYNVSSNAADAIAGTVGAGVGGVLTAGAGATLGASLLALPVAGYSSYVTKEALSGPIRLKKLPDELPPELEHLKDLP